MENITIRKMTTNDAGNVSRIICHNLQTVNSKDYDDKVINYMCNLFTPEYLVEISEKRLVLIALIEDNLVGTVNLHNDEICALYVHPDYHGYGIGKLLIKEIEREAKTLGIKKLSLSASLTAYDFYLKMGYVKTGDEDCEYFGKAHIMEKELN